MILKQQEMQNAVQEIQREKQIEIKSLESELERQRGHQNNFQVHDRQSQEYTK